MISRNTLTDWIKKGEGSQLDFKSSITSISKIARSIVAFANGRGGRIVVGVEDKGFISGIDIEAEKYQLEKAASQFCAPSVPITFEQVDFSQMGVLVALIKESTNKPHFADDKNGETQIYIRVGDECIIPPQAIQKLLRSGQMNHLFRTDQYYASQKKLINYLRDRQKITTAGYMKWAGVSERSALRILTDFALDGFLSIEEVKEEMSFSLV